MDYEQKYHLRPLWNSLLAIYNEFAKICDRNGLRYYGFAGTALGAVRKLEKYTRVPPVVW